MNSKSKNHGSEKLLQSWLTSEMFTTSSTPAHHNLSTTMLDIYQDTSTEAVYDEVTEALQVMFNNISTTSNSTLNSTADDVSESDPTVPEAIMTLYFILRVLIALLAVGGNTLTIVAIIKFEVLQNTTNLMVANLAVADLLTGLLMPAVIAQHVLRKLPVFVPLCLVEKTFSLISLRANLVFILWIAVDRYFYIVHPLKYVLWMTSKRATLLVTLTWLYISTDSALVMTFANVLKMGGTCKLSLVVDPKIYTRYLLPLVYICFPLTIACYAAIARVAIQQSRAIAALNQPFDTLEASTNQRQKKIAKMMFTVLATHLVSWLPQVCLAVVIQNNKTPVTLMMELVTTVIYFSNSYINPFIYAWKSKEFRLSFRRLLGMPNIVTPAHG